MQSIKMDQRVIQQKFYNPYRVMKLLFNTRKVWWLRSKKFSTWKCFTLRCLKCSWDRNAQVCHCIFKVKRIACKITITILWCFFNLKKYTTFFHCPATAVKSVVSTGTCIHNPNFVVKNSSHVILVFPVKIFFYLWINVSSL